MTIAPQPFTRSKQAHPEQTGGSRQANGAAAAALLAAGIGSAVLGINIILTEAWEPFERAFNLYAPVGPLSGQTTFAIVVWLGSWAVLHVWFDNQEVDLRVWLRATTILIAIGFLGTFPPFYGLFGG